MVVKWTDRMSLGAAKGTCDLPSSLVIPAPWAV